MPHVRRKDGKEFFPKGAFNAAKTIRYSTRRITQGCPKVPPPNCSTAKDLGQSGHMPLVNTSWVEHLVELVESLHSTPTRR